jgi:ankyrin repeat protein
MMFKGPWYDPLLVAIRDSHGQVSSNKIRNLISLGTDINACDWERNTALHYLSSGNNVDGIRILVDHGVNINTINAENKTALYVAMEKGAYDSVRCLLDLNASINRKCTFMQLTVLHLAAEQGELGLVSMLIERGGRVDILSKEKITPLMLACRNGYWYIAELLLSKRANIYRKDLYGRVALHFACMSGNLECVKGIYDFNPTAINEIAKHGYFSPYSEWDIISFAAFSGNIELLKYLFSIMPSSMIFPEKIICALSVAAECGHYSLVKWFLAHSTCKPQMMERAGILCAAIAGKNIDIIKEILRHGVNVDASTHDGATPLIFAVVCEDSAMVSFLLTAGAKVDIPDSNGWTALFHAVTHKNVECVNLLLQYGADPHKKCQGLSSYEMAQSNAEYISVVDCIKLFL